MGRRRTQQSGFLGDRRRGTCERNAPKTETSCMQGAAVQSVPRSRQELDDEEYLDIEPNKKGGTFSDQFLATMEHRMQQKQRAWVETLVELLIPFLFFIGVIILWCAFGEEIHPEKQMLNHTAVSSLTIPGFYKEVTCNNVSMGVIPGIEDCTTVPYSYNCSGDESSLPVKGLCFSDTLSGARLIALYLNAILGNAVRVPPLDTLIMMQWIARKFGRDITQGVGSAALAAAGMMDNTRYDAIMNSGMLYFAPRARVPTSLIDYLNNNTHYFQYVYGGTFDTVGEAENHVRTTLGFHWAIVEVNAFNTTDFDVVLHMNPTSLPPLTKVVDARYPGGYHFDRSEMYIASGFNSLQEALYQCYLRHLGYTDGELIHPYSTSLGYQSYKEKKLLKTASVLVAFILVLSFLHSVSQLTKRIVLEKELRIREAMQIMGLSSTSLHLSWLVTYALQYLPVCIVMTILMKLTLAPSSDAFVLFMTFYLFAMSTIPLSGLIAAFFSKARLASMLAPLIYFVLSVPTFASSTVSANAIIGMSLLSPTALAAVLTNILTLEVAAGFGPNQLNSNALTPKSSILYAVLAADFVLYYILMLYLDNVMPKDWGTRKHPLFFIIDPVMWCFNSKHKRLEGGADGRAENGVFEDVDGDDDAVVLDGLRKEYSRGGKTFVAVNNLYWGMREGEISVLLGHNGAGKTTVLNMMTGMVEPDAGDCYVYGYSVRNELERVRQQIGYCPQHNILWPNMTCYEHLWYYAALKGLRGAAQEEAISRMLAGVGLQDKRDYCSKMLSGGQKRKLSVAVAFVGGSRLVFLDEPTAGMDVGARRHTWTLLRAMAKYHTILLTTHFMDEADLLGDSVAIMSQGRLQCAGSNMFLKARLGVGYVLTLSVVAHVDRMTIAGMVREHVPSATRLGSGAGEMAFRLPMKTKAAFPTLLAEIESRGSQLGVNAYSVSATTLEEIFIQIAQQEEAKEEMERKRERLTAPFAGETRVCDSASVGPFESHMSALGDIGTVDAGYQGPPRPSDVWNVGLIANELSVLHSQFKAMLWKRLWNALRDRRTQFFQIVCPMLCVLLAMLLMLIKLFRYPAITLSSDLYGTTVEIDVAGCGSGMNLSIPFSSKAVTVQPPSATSTATLSSYMLETYNTHVAERYTGMVCFEAVKFPMTFRTFNRSVSSVIYNTSGLHSNVIGLYNLYNGYYMAHRGNNASVMTTVVQAIPKTKTEVEVQDSIYALIISIVIMIPFTFIPSTFVSWIVKERECKARHLQNVSGLYFSVYWITNFLFDICCYVVTMLLILIVFAIFSRDEYIGERAVGATIVLFLLYGLSGVAMAYAVSFLFKEHSTAQNVVMLANFITGFLLVICVSMLSVFESTKKVAKVLPWIFRIVPSFCVGEGIGNLAALKLEEPFGTTKTPWSMSVVGWPCVYMAVGLPLYVFVTLFLDHPGRRQRTQRLFYNSNAEPEVVQNEDEDVAAERRSVLESEARQRDLVRVENLSKVYSNGKVAVRNITFGVRPGEVFGFLGTNGAGKTTTISILCQEIHPTAGRASICGNDIVMESREALRCIGYCPQFDACLDLLTVEEHLELYAGVRAISYNCRKRVVEGLLALCELTNYKHTLAHALSGGNRRKLSVAISLIGGPRVVFLDEPSAGMDPVARRGMWTAIEAVADNSSVVLTTQDVEEVEALAHRVAIMVDGTLRCIGDKTHLKNKFGTGFEVNVRIRSDEEEVKEDIRSFFRENFPGSSLREYRAHRLTFELPAGTKLSRTLGLMEEHVLAVGATGYSVSQTSIEQVFMQISEEAERQREAEEVEQLSRATKGCCTCCC